MTHSATTNTSLSSLVQVVPGAHHHRQSPSVTISRPKTSHPHHPPRSPTPHHFPPQDLPHPHHLPLCPTPHHLPLHYLPPPLNHSQQTLSGNVGKLTPGRDSLRIPPPSPSSQVWDNEPDKAGGMRANWQDTIRASSTKRRSIVPNSVSFETYNRAPPPPTSPPPYSAVRFACYKPATPHQSQQAPSFLRMKNKTDPRIYLEESERVFKVSFTF